MGGVEKGGASKAKGGVGVVAQERGGDDERREARSRFCAAVSLVSLVSGLWSGWESGRSKRKCLSSQTTPMAQPGARSNSRGPVADAIG